MSAHDPLEDAGGKVVDKDVPRHGHVLLEADLAVGVDVARGEEAVDDVLQLRKGTLRYASARAKTRAVLGGPTWGSLKLRA